MREGAALATIRRILLILFLIGVVGTGLELLLLDHTEDLWQWAPLVLMALSLVTLGWRLADRGAASLRLFQSTMVLFALSGVVGLWLHYQGNVEFELEMYPSMQGLELFRESVTGATPTLAPGAMLELGLLGLAYAYRHPALSDEHRATYNAPRAEQPNPAAPDVEN